MNTIEQSLEIVGDKLQQCVFPRLSTQSATLNAAVVVIFCV